jgi:translation initiation factor 4A
MTDLKEDDKQQNKDTSDEVTVSNWNDRFTSFEDMKLKDTLLRGIFGFGWEIPSAIQQVGIVPVIKKRDSVIQAQSGTGKTGTFSIAALERVDTNIDGSQVIILSPTREIASQSCRVIKALALHMKDVKIVAVIGGRKLDQKEVAEAHIVVATPGRVYDMMHRGVIKLDKLKLFILDEADIMLNKGFQSQIIEIFKYVPKNTQVAIYSATMPREILDVTKNFMENPVKILVKKEQLTLEGIKQFFIGMNKEEDKVDTICDIYDTLKINQSIIYVSSKRKVEWLADYMRQNDFPVSHIHGDMQQSERDEIMAEFRNGNSRVLISTDLLARGIDIHQISLVINYDLPSDKENYIHRIGRSGRYGKKGVSINFVTTKDVNDMREIEKYYNTIMEEMPIDISDYIS